MNLRNIECKNHNSGSLLSFSKYPNHLKVCDKCLLIFKHYKNPVKHVTSLKKFNDKKFFNISNEEIKSEIKLINKFLKILNIKDKIEVLDYGCGYGSFLEALKRKKIKGYGYDVNKFFYKNLNYKYNMFRERKKIEKSNKKFDIIFLRKVLNLSSNIIEDFIFFKKILKKNGHLIILDQVTEYNKFAYSSLYFKKKSNNTYLLSLESLIKIAKSFHLKIIKKNNFFGNIELILKNIDLGTSNFIKENKLYNFKVKMKIHLYSGFMFIFFYKILNYLKILIKNLSMPK